MDKVKLTITKSSCRSGYHKQGDVFLVTDICPPLCHELWHLIYPNVYTLLNGGELDYGNERTKCFDSICPDGGRVHIHGEVLKEN
ncbi:TIGR04076 family protein [Clostridium sp. KNHs205]|uniref:TIGR04076 family protein n=1 Tax=Clostridium sp. KNHs205 TaxID=1449050 RepID=UPI00051C9BEF|nr:TIGR04076 family protein [Clostridium sp. KNHs205]